jgi:Xaa-Pro dipeptidase
MSNYIPESEFIDRLSALRSSMKRGNFEALLIFSQKRGHVAYVSGYRPNYHTNSAIIILPLVGNPILLIKFPFDLSRARSVSWFTDIRASVSEDQERMVAQCAESIRSLALERSRIGLVAADLAVDELSLSLYEHIRTHLPKAQFEPASDLLNELRLVKSQNEIEHLRGAAQLAELVADEFRKAVRPGTKDHVAVAAALHVARLEGADDCSMILSLDPSRMALPPSGSEFRQGDEISCEITVQYHGYWIQICRVLSIGKPNAAQREIFEVCRGAHEAAVRAAKPGASVARLVEEAHQVIANAGYKDYIEYGPGHGVGLDLPELYPLDSQCKGLLSPGMVLVIHPAIWVPGGGTAFVGGPISVSDGRVVRLDRPQSEIIQI